MKSIFVFMLDMFSSAAVIVVVFLQLGVVDGLTI